VTLCIDIGNTSIKMARVSRGRVRDARAVSSRSSAREIARAVARTARGGVTGAAIASVRPASTEPVRRAVGHELGADPLVVTHRVELPIVLATRRPARVGADRICAACGALSGRARGAIIVDAGSAITADLVLDRRLVGGLIMPGPQMMLSALHRFTAQLPALRVEDGPAGALDDTAPAMLTGSVIAAVGAIETAVRLLRQRAGRRLPVWLTGGHAARLSGYFPKDWIRDPHLTLRGIAVVAELNQHRPY
jgi:type III pantothenate kinase